MEDQTKAELIEASSSVAASLLKEMLVHRRRMSRIEAEKEKEIEIAEARERARAEHMGGVQGGQPSRRGRPAKNPGGGQEPPQEIEPQSSIQEPPEPETETVHVASIAEAVDVGADPLEQISLAKGATDCQFCQNVLEQLKSESEDVQRQGLQELVEYEQLTDELVAKNASRDEQEERIDEIMEDWQAIPMLIAP